MAKKKKAKKVARGKKIPAKQGKSKVGYKKSPEETQFSKGESGNPAGPPVRRTQLWVWFCKFMDMTDKELAKLNRKKLTQAQQTALKLVENAKDGKYSGSERLARHVFDREEGKALQTQVVKGAIGTRELSDEEMARLVQDKTIDCDDAIAG